MGSPGPLGGAVPTLAASARVRTQRLAKPVALLPAREMAWTIPSPLNQW